MAVTLEVTKGDLVFEAAFPRPEFTLFRDIGHLFDRLFVHLEPHGLRVHDIRVERGSGTVADQHALLYLFNYWMTVRVRVDRVEVTCTELPRAAVPAFATAIVGVLRAVLEHRPALQFHTFAIVLGLHGTLAGQPVREYLARFAGEPPKNLGPSTGAGAVFYFGPEDTRLFSTLTTDRSGIVPDGLFVRLHGAWDATRVLPDALPDVASTFIRRAVDSLGLALPA